MDLPEPLFESHLHQRALCLVCARKLAKTVLRTTGRPIVPICEDCSANWNFYGYQILKRINPGQLLRRILAFKLRHPFQQPSTRTIWRHVANFQEWTAKMKKWVR